MDIFRHKHSFSLTVYSSPEGNVIVELIREGRRGLEKALVG
jgi:hypothetical protein